MAAVKQTYTEVSECDVTVQWVLEWVYTENGAFSHLARIFGRLEAQLILYNNLITLVK